MNIIDYTGRKVGYIKVLKRIGYYNAPSGQKQPLWECECTKCGRIFNLKSQDIKYKIDHNIQNCNKCGLDPITGKNKYIFHEDYVTGYTSKQEPFYVDRDDFELIKDYCWYINDQGYVIYKSKENGNLRMHRLIMSQYYDIDGYDIDHIRENSRNDNRKKNLRIATRTQNNMNRNKIGVHIVKKTNKWQAGITVNGQYHHLGVYDNKEDAIAARKRGEEQYFKEYSYSYSQSIAMEEPK